MHVILKYIVSGRGWRAFNGGVWHVLGHIHVRNIDFGIYLI